MGFRAKNVIAGCLVVTALVVASVTHALTFTGSGPGNDPGETLEASATFSVSNQDLVVTLSNTGAFDPNDAPDILTAILFTIAGDPILTPVSAQVAPGSFLTGHRLLPGFMGDVGSQWAYRNGLAGAPLGANEGISSTDLNWFGKKNLFSTVKIPGAKSFNGVSFGLTTLFDFPANDRGSIKNQTLIENSAVFVFSGLPAEFAVSSISNVTFQYGTSVKQPELMGVALIPEPTTILLAAAGLGALAFSCRRRV